MDWELFHSATNLLIVLKSPGTVGWTECLDGAIFGRGFLGVSNDRRIQEPAPSVPAMGCKMGGGPFQAPPRLMGPAETVTRMVERHQRRRIFQKYSVYQHLHHLSLCSDAE